MNIDKEMQNGQGFVQWFVIHAVSRPGQSKPDLIDRIIAAKPVNVPGCGTDLRMQINGIEVDPVVCLKTMEADFDRQVKLAAAELIKEKLGPTLGLLHTTVEEATRAFRIKVGLPENPEY